MARTRRAAKQPPPPASPGRFDAVTLAVLGVGLAAATAFVIAHDAEHGYQRYQRGFRDAVSRTAGTAAAETVPSGPQQIWVAGLGRADRCVTCHQGIAWASFEQAAQP